MTQAVWDVALDPRAAGLEPIFSYQADPSEPDAIGRAVMVPLGRREVLGFVIGERTVTESELGFPFSELRPVAEVIDGIRIPPVQVRLATWIAEQYLCSVPTALSLAVPPGLRDRLITRWELTGTAYTGRSAATLEALRTIEASDRVYREKVGVKTEAGVLKILKALRRDGVLRSKLELAPFQDRRVTERMYRLCPSTEQIDRFVRDHGKKRPAQVLTVMRLQSAPSLVLSAGEIRAMAGVTDTTVRAVIDAGVLVEVESDALEAERQAPPELNAAQALAFEAVRESIVRQVGERYLLFGVTGSGKTEVYLRCIAEALAQGKQALYLVPEIALATQAIAQLRRRFGRGVVVLHSELTPLERLKTWMRIAQGEVAIVLGPRSALFAPMPNLGVVILDEEHESAYKQDSNPRYHGRRVATELVGRQQCPLVLGSATPSLESFFEAQQTEALAVEQDALTARSSRLTLLTLPTRAVASASLPPVQIADLGEPFRRSQPSLFLPSLKDGLEFALEQGNQAILLYNRRAYAPFLQCRTCGHRVGCPHCSVTLSYHRGINQLRCHQCGYATDAYTECVNCDRGKMLPFGVGTERIEQALRDEFPTARIARLDRDVAARKGALETILTQFRNQELDFLVGTQMVAKGLDFPNVTLVGVISADVSLSVPEFRSEERTYQLLSQVAGRAGRGTKPGKVIIQTFTPEHPAVRLVAEHDYPNFYDYAIKIREEAGYPPYCRLVNVVVSSAEPVHQSPEFAEFGRDIAQHFTVRGPAPCPLERIRDQNRWHFLVALREDESPAALRALADRYQSRTTWQITVDVDPMNLM
ncbi:MAG: primosomal protein N' [Fimbriimonadaceae bacterium]|nr:primosomal protein N' [Fimbriimonadaceae bacterium]